MASYVTTDNLKTVVQRLQKTIPDKTSQIENDSSFVTKDEIADVIDGKVLNKQEANTLYAAINHNHDDVYAKTSNVNSAISSLTNKVNLVNNTFSNYYNKDEADNRYLSKNQADIAYALIDHNHDDVYAKTVNVNKSIATVNANIRDTNDRLDDIYTKEEVDEKLDELDVTKLKREVIGVSNTVATISNKVGTFAQKSDIPDVSVYARQTSLDVLSNTVAGMYTNAQIDGKLSEIKINGGGDSGSVDIDLDDFKNVIAGEGYAKETWADAKFALIADTYTKNEVDAAIAASKSNINTELTSTTSKVDNVIDTVIPTLATKEEIENISVDTTDLVTKTEFRAVSNKVDDIINIDLPTFATKEDLAKINVDGVDLTTFATHDEVTAAKADIKLDITSLEDSINSKISDIVDNTIPTLATKEELKNITIDTSGFVSQDDLTTVETKVDNIVNNTIPTLATKEDLNNITIDTSGFATKEDLKNVTIDTSNLATKEDLKNVTVDTSDLAKAADLTALSTKVTDIEDTAIPTLATKQELTDAINAIPAVEVNKEYVATAIANGVEPYLSKEDAADTYINKTDAASTYLSKADAETTYLSQINASNTYLTKADAESLFVTETKVTDLRAEMKTATDNASSAKTTAGTANETANTANTTAESAKTTAEAANATAEEAKTSAENSAAAVTKCQSDVADALEKVADIKMKVASVYTAAGSRLFETLPEPSEDNLGYVYNVIDAFTTNDKFLEGEGISTAAGTNVVVVLGSDNTYQYDLLSIGNIAPLVATADEVLSFITVDDTVTDSSGGTDETTTA